MSGARSNSDDTLRRMLGDLPFFGRQCLKVKNKAGQIVPFTLNPAQIALHEAIEEQRARTGMVRILGLKGRKQGFSTYTEARYYWKTSLKAGRNAYILTHEQPASDTIFAMVDRFQRHNPMPPHVGVSNAKEMVFDVLESSYQVATAGAKAGGRGRDVHLFHGSEVAFWPNAPTHFAASIQAVPMEPGTEVILESTSNGTSGEWYERCQDALAKRGDYELVFIPWFMSPEYSREPELNFTLDDDAEDGQLSEREYAEAYGLTDAQMSWRRSKIAELRSTQLFMQEYPANIQESFQSAGHEPFISAISILKARKRRIDGDMHPLVIGVDPAGSGGDRFAVCWRRGPRVLKIRFRNKIGHEEAVEWLASIIDEDNPARMNIDLGHIGTNIYQTLRAKSPRYAKLVRGVNFGDTSQAKKARPQRPGPRNRRAEMWDRAREWLNLPEGVDLPDDDALQSDLSAPKKLPQLNGDFLLESKKDMKARGVRSPDLADAFCLTFASNEFLTGSAPKPDVPRFGAVEQPVAHGPAPGGFESFEGRWAGTGSWMT